MAALRVFSIQISDEYKEQVGFQGFCLMSHDGTYNLFHVPMLYLSGYIIGHKAIYYRLLQEVRTRDNWEGWVLFMLKAIEDTATQAISQIHGINSIFNEIQDKVKTEAPKIYSKDLVEQLFVHPYTKIEYISNGLGVERKAASRYLKKP